MIGNPFLFNDKNRHEELSRLSEEDMQTNETNETATNIKNKHPRESNPHQYAKGVPYIMPPIFLC
jgi:hypothetical protein